MSIHFRILDDTLCGAEYKPPNKKTAKQGRFCNDCVQVMWQEQYKRGVLVSLQSKITIPDKTTPDLGIFANRDVENDSPLYLKDYLDYLSKE